MRLRNIWNYYRFSYAETWKLVNLFSGTKNFSYRICYENIGGKYSRNLVKSARENLATLSFHFIEIQVTNQMMLRHEKTIHYYIQKTSSKQIQRKKWWDILEAAKFSPPNISWLQARKIVSMKTLYEEHSSKRYIFILKFNVTFINKSHGDTKRRCVI